MYRSRQRRVGGGNGMLYMLALHAASKFMQLPRKPPVTASLILANTVVYLRPGVLDTILPTVEQVCLSPYRVIRDLDAKRLFLSAFYHMDDAHLVYNMVSLLWKGVQLESNMGSARFAGMVTVLLGMSHGLVVISAKLLAMYGGTPGPMYSECAVGFSAVLFAMKMVLNWDSPDYTNVYGVLVPSKYAAWAELLLIQLFVPGTSFLGHLCGILAGLIYVNSGPLLRGRYSPFVWGKRLLERPVSLLLWPFRSILGWRPQGRIHGRGTSGSRNDGAWRCQVCTYDNGRLRVDCEMCGSARGTTPGSGGEEPDATAPPWPEEEQQY
ncbi:unnamed protein product [Calypogeia fissa]